MLTISHKKDILIIEDDAGTANLLCDFLKKLDYQNIHICKDGTSGIKKFEELVKLSIHPLVFLDYYLPDMTGLSVFTQLLKIRPDTKVVIETIAGIDQAGVKDLTERGAYHYLQKPFTFENIKEVMGTFEVEQK